MSKNTSNVVLKVVTIFLVNHKNDNYIPANKKCPKANKTAITYMTLFEYHMHMLFKSKKCRNIIECKQRQRKKEIYAKK